MIDKDVEEWFEDELEWMLIEQDFGKPWREIQKEWEPLTVEQIQLAENILRGQPLEGRALAILNQTLIKTALKSPTIKGMK